MEGAQVIADLLKTNTTLTSVRYAAAPPFPYCQHPLTVFILCLLPAYSLNSNALTNYGADMSGIIQFADALKQNSSLTSLSCVAHRLNSSPKCQHP